MFGLKPAHDLNLGFEVLLCSLRGTTFIWYSGPVSLITDSFSFGFKSCRHPGGERELDCFRWPGLVLVCCVAVCFALWAWWPVKF